MEKGFSSWFKENIPKEGLSENTTFSKQFVKDAWNNGCIAGLNKAKECANCPVWLLNQPEKNCKDCEHKEALILLRR